MPTLFDSNSVSQLAPAHHEIPGPLPAVVTETHEQWWRPFTWCVQTTCMPSARTTTKACPSHTPADTRDHRGMRTLACPEISVTTLRSMIEPRMSCPPAPTRC